MYDMFGNAWARCAAGDGTPVARGVEGVCESATHTRVYGNGGAVDR
jgi:hypothetical protein